MAASGFTGLSAATAITDDDLLCVTDDPAGTPVSKKVTANIARSYATNGAIVSGSDANTTMVVNTTYVVNMSAWATADRTYTLPTTAAVGDRIRIIISAGNTSTFELIVTAASGDTLNAVAGGTEWSRLFITGETLDLLCISANSAWVVQHDGRIPQVMALRLSTSCTTNTANADSLPTSGGGAWTADINVGNAADTSTGKFIARRACNVCESIAGYSVGTILDTKKAILKTKVNGVDNSGAFAGINAAANTQFYPNATAQAVSLAAGDYIQYFFNTEQADMGLTAFAGAGVNVTSFHVREIL